MLFALLVKEFELIAISKSVPLFLYKPLQQVLPRSPFSKVQLGPSSTSNPALLGPPKPAVLPDWGSDKPDTGTRWPPHGFDFCVISSCRLPAERAEESLRPRLRPACWLVVKACGVQRWPAFCCCNKRAEDCRRLTVHTAEEMRLSLCMWALNKSRYSVKWKSPCLITAEFRLKCAATKDFGSNSKKTPTAFLSLNLSDSVTPLMKQRWR